MHGFFRFLLKLKAGLFVVLLLIILTAQVVLAQGEQILYAPQAGTPARTANFLEPESGCNWAGVGGQVFDRYGNPQIGLVIKLWGTVDGKPVQYYAVSGGSTKLGPGGFLMKIAGHPVATEGNLKLQVLDITGSVLAGPVSLFTAADCAQNLLVVNIKEMVYSYLTYFPIARYYPIPRN